MKPLPGTEFIGPKRLPWPGTLSRRIARILWADLEPFFNLSPPEDAGKLLASESDEGDHFRVYQKMRDLMQELVDGRLSLVGKPMPATPLALIGSRRWGVSWGIRHIDHLTASVEDRRAHCRFLLGLLALPEVRPLLRQCSTCSAFMLKRAVKKQKKTATRRDFCSPACRRWSASREDNARRQREYRERNPGRRTRA